MWMGRASAWEDPRGRRTAMNNSTVTTVSSRLRTTTGMKLSCTQNTTCSYIHRCQYQTSVMEWQHAQSCFQNKTIEARQFITSVRIKRWYFNFSVLHLSTLKVRSCPKNIKKMFLCRTACFIWAVGLILLPLKLRDKSLLTWIGAGSGPIYGRCEWLC